MHKYSLFRAVCADECTREITTIGSEFKILQAFNAQEDGHISANHKPSIYLIRSTVQTVIL